jgi:hypothetical protein
MKTFREYVMTRGLNRSFAARATANSDAISSSGQRISRTALSREMASPGRTHFIAAATFSEAFEITVTLRRMIQRPNMLM